MTGLGYIINLPEETNPLTQIKRDFIFGVREVIKFISSPNIRKFSFQHIENHSGKIFLSSSTILLLLRHYKKKAQKIDKKDITKK